VAVVLGSAGFQTTVQDCGRFGLKKLGVTTAGALDSSALHVINLLVGNSEYAAGLEIASGRVRLEFTDDRLIAWSGGDFEVCVGNHLLPPLHCGRASASANCEISPRRGRAWVAISGGIDVPEVLGSRSTDLRAGFGGWRGRALRNGDELPLGPVNALSLRIARTITNLVADWSALPLVRAGNPLRVVRGRNWSDETGSQLLASRFRVAINSDRMGLRLEGHQIESPETGERVSEAVVPGTIQLPRGGVPIVLLGDCQTIGGYPKLAHVITVDLARAAQLQPMDEVSFEITTLEHARELLRAREDDIALFRAGLQARFG
jgi:antagonist of KipI